MITAIMVGPSGEKIHPRYERLIFDTLDQCQFAMQNENLKMLMATTVELAYPGYLLEQIGCGAWNMDSQLDLSRENSQPLNYY